MSKLLSHLLVDFLETFNNSEFVALSSLLCLGIPNSHTQQHWHNQFDNFVILFSDGVKLHNSALLLRTLSPLKLMKGTVNVHTADPIHIHNSSKKKKKKS